MQLNKNYACMNTVYNICSSDSIQATTEFVNINVCPECLSGCTISYVYRHAYLMSVVSSSNPRYFLFFFHQIFSIFHGFLDRNSKYDFRETFYLNQNQNQNKQSN